MFQGGFQKAFRWLHASGTTIGSYTNGTGTVAALRPVNPGGSNVFELLARPSRASAGTRPTESSKQSAFQGSCQLLPPPGQAGRKAIPTHFLRNQNATYFNRGIVHRLSPTPSLLAILLMMGARCFLCLNVIFFAAPCSRPKE